MSDMIDRIIHADAVDGLKTIPDNTVNTCVTSPPYYRLRDYGVAGQIGLEDTPEAYIDRLVTVFREVKRVLKSDGTLWVVINDSYNGSGKGGGNKNTAVCTSPTSLVDLKPKDMIGIPWMLAFALRDDGWYLRNDIIWYKGNPMPENVQDRCSRAYEHIFLFAKSKKYYFNADTIADPIKQSSVERMKRGRSDNNKYVNGIPGQPKQSINGPRVKNSISDELIPVTRNKRDVWEINTVPYKGAHFAAFPPKLVETCILAGCSAGGIVLDPFAGSGTTCMVAKQLDRRYIGIEINADYCRLAEKRVNKC
jgi:DNA modification methylase